MTWPPTGPKPSARQKCCNVRVLRPEMWPTLVPTEDALAAHHHLPLLSVLHSNPVTAHHSHLRPCGWPDRAEVSAAAISWVRADREGFGHGVGGADNHSRQRRLEPGADRGG